VLKMKAECERCSQALSPNTATAYICSFECTFCAACSAAMSGACPNCNGELVRRPTRTRTVADVATSQIATRLRRLFGLG
jgi:hypothetical protein